MSTTFGSTGITDDHGDEDYYIDEKFDFCSLICLEDYQMKLEEREGQGSWPTTA